MLKHGAKAFICLCLLLLAGCQAAQVRHDGIRFRHAVVDIYTEQAMDNLIRARIGMPFVQLAYSDLLVQDTDTLTGNIAGSAVGSGANALGLFGEGKRDKIMSFHADPVVDRNDVYEAYIAFANDPGLFVMSESPPCGPTHIYKEHCGHHFWVPCDAGPLFMALVLKTSFMKSPSPPPPAYFEVTIADIIEEEGDGDLKNYKFTFNQSIPNGNGRLEIALADDSVLALQMERVLGPNGKPVGGEQTNTLEIQWNKTKKKFDLMSLRGQQGKLYSEIATPPEPEGQAELKRLFQSLDRIRATQSLSN